MRRLFWLIVFACCSGPALAGDLIGDEFTYQGHLKQSGQPANGEFDFDFAIYDAESGGTQLGSSVDLEDVSVADGVFSVALDFGQSAFTDEPIWLQISVREGASTGAYTILQPRQSITAVPFSFRTLDDRVVRKDASMTVSFAAFHDITFGSTGCDFRGTYYAAGAGDDCVAVAPVPLKPSVVLHSLFCDVFDNDAAIDAFVQISLNVRRYPLGTIEEVFRTDPSFESSFPVTMVDNTANSDNEVNYYESYWLEAQFGNGAPVGNSVLLLDCTINQGPAED